MSLIVTPDTMASVINGLDQRIRTLETANPLERATIKQGSLIIIGGSTGTLPTGQPLPQQAGERARLGLQPDGSYGVRLLDASGNVIFDPTGLQGVSKILASGASGTTIGPLANTATITTTGASVGFSLSRANSVLLIATATFYLSTGGTSSYGRIYLGTDTVTNITPRQVVNNGSFGGLAEVANSLFALPLALAAGAYTASLYYAVPDGNSVLNVASWSIDVLLFGG